jgi:hypothetical protein
MRRGFSIFLILFFGLGPLSSTIDGSEDANLPLCCRRHGAHHCAMAMHMAAMRARAESGSTPAVSVPPTCPQFPGAAAMFATPASALMASAASAPDEIGPAHAFVGEPVAVFFAPSRAHAGRGPPEANLN